MSDYPQTIERARADAKAAGLSEIVFVCGALRSGTTLLRLMLDAHPALSNPAEMDFLFDALPEPGAPLEPERVRERVEGSRVFRRLGLTIDEALDPYDLVRDLADQCRRPGALLTINLHRRFDRAAAVFPQARFVHLLRDPRDVAASAIAMGWSGNVYHGVDHWIASERDFEALRAAVASDRIYEFKHEDLIGEPARTLAALCAFLGVDYDDAMLTYPETSTYSAPDPEMTERWRQRLGDDEIRQVEAKAFAMMKARGYEPISETAPTIDARTAARLARENRIGRLRFHVKRYGVALTALDVIQRRVPIPAFQKAVRERVERRSLEFLK